jgi:hypothetical protein
MAQGMSNALDDCLSIRTIVSAAGEVTGERATRLARIATILGAPAPMPRSDA